MERDDELVHDAPRDLYREPQGGVVSYALPRPSKPSREGERRYLWLRLKPFPRLTANLHDDERR